MWSKLYLPRNSNNKEVVVALMDTQVEQWKVWDNRFLMWFYLLRNSNNKEVVVALIDTQVEQ